MTSRFCTPCKLLFIYDKSKRTCLCLVKRKVLPKIFRILPELCWQSLPRRKRILDLLLALPSLPFLRFKRLCVDVLATFSCLSANLFVGCKNAAVMRELYVLTMVIVQEI